MKLLVYTTLYPNAAQPNLGIFIEKRLQQLLKRFPADVRVIAPVPWSPRWLKAERYRALAAVPRRERRGDIEVLHPRYLVVPGLSWRIAPVFQFIGALRDVWRVRREGFDFELIDAHFVFPDAIAALGFGVLLRKPVCITARGSDINDSPRYAVPRAMIRWGLRRADRVIAVSQELAAKMRALSRRPLDVEVLPNGVDRTLFYPRAGSVLREHRTIAGPVVLTVGNLRKLKGHDILIRAIACLDGVSLVIIGTGEERENLRQLISDNGLDARVSLVGEIANDELPDYYSGADVFALASSSEGCPNVILEAIACGTPVVATAVGAIPDLVPEGGRRLLVSERTPSAFADAIRACLDDPPSREQILAKAETLGWTSTCERLHAVMTEAAA